MSYELQDYEEWLDITGLEDTEENRGWYDCPDEDRSQYINDNPEWWESF